MELIASPRSEARKTSSPLTSAEPLEENRGDRDFAERQGDRRTFMTALPADGIDAFLPLEGSIGLLFLIQRLVRHTPLELAEAMFYHVRDARHAEVTPAQRLATVQEWTVVLRLAHAP